MSNSFPDPSTATSALILLVCAGLVGCMWVADQVHQFRDRRSRSSTAVVHTMDHSPLDPAKARVRINQNGWVRHDGAPFPFDPKLLVEIVFANGVMISAEYAARAGFWDSTWWTHQSEDPCRHIRWYRIIGYHDAR